MHFLVFHCNGWLAGFVKKKEKGGLRSCGKMRIRLSEAAGFLAKQRHAFVKIPPRYSDTCLVYKQHQSSYVTGAVMPKSFTSILILP
jgi:hypothetical protein